MKQIFRKINLFFFVAMCSCMVAITTGCKKDNEPENNNSIVGVWTEDFYNDVIELKANGSGSWAEYYGDPDASSFTWTYQNGLLKIIMYGDLEEARMISQTEDMITWKHYVDNPSAYTDSEIKKDDYGYYYIWIWERYN